ncbi:MAG: DNA polymerase IV [Bacteroidota bacterium]
MERAVLHLDLDTFFVSVERLKDQRLHGKPVLVGGTGGRGVVSSCSYEARKFGVYAGMPTRMARRLCPQGIFLKGDFEAYQAHSQMITEIVQEEAPLFEKASVDEFYVDMTGMERFVGSRKWANHLRQRIQREAKLPLSFGLSVNKLVAKVATNAAKPNGEREVSIKQIAPFLDPLRVRKIPLIGPQTARELAYMGVKYVRTLKGIPLLLLEQAFGKHGRTLYQRARGEDNRPIVPHVDRQSISTERTFTEDTMDIAQLRAQLIRMTEQLAFQLRQSSKLTACVKVRIRYSDFETVTRQAKLPFTASDEVLLPKVLQLFDKLYTRRVRLRLVGVGFSKLVSGRPQIQLFTSQARQVELYEALDALKHKHGSQIVQRASGL